MNTHYSFSQSETDSIINRFGQPFYSKMIKDLDSCADRWGLTALRLIPSYSANLVFTCHSASFGDAVLKVGNPAFGGVHTEYQALREYNGRRFCQVFDADLENCILLEERVQPGIPLRDEPSLERRLAVFSELYRELHIAPADAAIYPSYTGWVSRITDYMSRRPDCAELYAYMRKANDICLSLSAAYSKQMLLHGDLHHDNMLRREDGSYAIIDPKGVVGDPVFDIPRFILNEFSDEVTAELFGHINGIIISLERQLHLPSDVIRKCLFVETTMGMCWSVESGATAEEYPSLVEKAAFAEAILNS